MLPSFDSMRTILMTLLTLILQPPFTLFFFFNEPAPPEIYPLSLPDALPILSPGQLPCIVEHVNGAGIEVEHDLPCVADDLAGAPPRALHTVLIQIHRHRTPGDLTLHEDAARVFAIDVQSAPMSAQCKHPAWKPEERVRIIQIVDLR